MSAIRGYAAEDATIIFGTVYDESLSDAIRVTVVATGLNGPRKAQKEPNVEIVWTKGTGTYGPQSAVPVTGLTEYAPVSPITVNVKQTMGASNFANTQSDPIYEMNIPVLSEPGQMNSQPNASPQVTRPNPSRGVGHLNTASSPQAKAMLEKGAEFFEIPAFLRKQAD
jgi:cell division protein FtsZ